MERADAARNRRAILHATERLLAERGAEHISLDEVAATAGVGKGTVFRRFGSRTGLLRALILERVHELQEAIASGPPPLGPGAPPVARLTAFFDAVIDIATRNSALMRAYDHALANQEPAAGTRHHNEIYLTWHAHVAGLIATARPDLDAELLAHILLSSLHSDQVRHLLQHGESARLRDTLHTLTQTLLRTGRPRVRPGG